MIYKVGYSPLHYFILGICEIFVTLFLIVVVHNTSTVSELISYIADNDVLLFLPVYFVIINLLLFIGVCISVEHVVGYYVDDVLFIICHWFILRVIAESTSVFFLHAGFGRRSARESFLVGFFSTSIFATVLLLCYFFGPDYVALIVCGICILLVLFVYHIISWLLPLKYFHRRPAAKHFSLLNAIILLLQILSLFAASVSPNGGHDRDTAVKFFFTVTEMFQIMINLFAFSEDSMYWQGLFVDDSANLNHPLLGVWEMNSGVIHTAVSRTITQLERKVVKIIPYSHLSVDTSKYFAGGSARVYKGFYDRGEVAIKFLFCIELTPDRVVDFCNEATLLNSLQHPNVVKCFGVAIMPPAISLVTEYCSFGSLFDFLHSTDLVVNEGDHRASLSSGSDGMNRIRTSTSDSMGRERTSTSSGRYRANSRPLAVEALGGSRDSFGASGGAGITNTAGGGGVGSGSGRYRAHSKAVTVDRDSLSSVNSKSINLEFIRRDSEPVVGHTGSGDIEQGAEGTTISPLQQQHPFQLQPVSSGPNTGAAQRSSAGRGFTFSFNWNSGTNSTTTPSTPLHNPVRADSTAAAAVGATPSSDGPPYPNEHLLRYMDAESMDIATRLAEAMTNKSGGGVGLSQKHSHEPRSRNNSLRWHSSNSYRLPRMPSLQGGGGGGAMVDNRVAVPPPPPAPSAAAAAAPAEPKYFAPVSTPTAPRIRSATSVLLSKDMGFGLGPQPLMTRNRESSVVGGGANSSAVTPGGAMMTPGGGGGAAGGGGGGVRTYSVSRPASPLASASPHNYNKRTSKGSNKSNSKSKSRLSSASLLVGLISPPSVHSVGRLLPPATKLRMARDCCAGLAFLHSKNLMHCDIKSLNFLVCSDLTVKLSDLGETRLLGDNHDADSSSDQRDMPVNTNWSSPELLSGQRHLVNQAADVWSLAMVIVEIMTGEVPYDTPEYRSLPLDEFVHRLKANERPSLPKAFLQKLWLEDLLYDAWHFDPALRCSAETMLKVFDENLKE